MSSASLSADSPPSDYGRPASIEERTNRYIVHPISGVVEKAALRLGVSANAVSLLGLAMGFLAAYFYYYQSSLVAVAAGFLSMAAWHVFDGADGRIARATGTSSAFGRILDGICDHLVFAAVYLATTFYMLKTGMPLIIWALVIAAGVSHAAQAAAYEERRQRYQRRSKGQLREEVNENLTSVNGKPSFFAVGYDKIQTLLAGAPTTLDEALGQMRRSGASSAAIQRAVNKTAPLVNRWSLLNANNRTIMIAIFAAVGQPFLYFLYEALALNIVLLWLLQHERQVEEKIAESLASSVEQT